MWLGNRKISWEYLIVLTTITIVLFNPIALFLPLRLVIVILLLLSLYSSPKVYLQNSIILYWTFISIVLISNGLFEREYWPFLKEIDDACFLTLFLLCGYYIQSLSNREIQVCYKWGVFLMIVTTLITITLSVRYPDVVRLRFSEENSDLALANNFDRIGLMTYGFGHALASIPPLMVFRYRRTKKKKSKFLALVLLGLTLAAIFMGVITTSFILSVLTLFATIIYHHKYKIRLVLIVSALTAVFAFFGKTPIIISLKFLQSLAVGRMMESKMESLIDSIIGESSELDYRVELREKSQISFYEHPLFGTFDKESIGGHAFIFDFLGFYGIIICSLLFIAIALAVKRVYKSLSKEARPYYLLANAPLIGLALLKGYPSIHYFAFLFLIIPLFALHFDRNGFTASS